MPTRRFLVWEVARAYPLEGRWDEAEAAMADLMSLEAFQSGLSWITILRKRPAFRAAFADFSIPEVAAFTERDAARLMADPGIVRNRMKVDATLHNARVAAARR